MRIVTEDHVPQQNGVDADAGFASGRRLTVFSHHFHGVKRRRGSDAAPKCAALHKVRGGV